MAETTIGAGYPRGLLEFATRKGADRAALLGRAGLSESDLERQDNHVPLERYLALIDAAAALTGEPAIMLQYGEAVRMQEISIVGLICEACETTVDVARQLNRYAALVVDEGLEEPATLMRGAFADGGFWVEGPSALFANNPRVCEAEFARLVWNARVMFRDSEAFKTIGWPREVHFRFADPGYRAEFERVFQAPVTFDSHWNAMLIDPAFLTLKQPPVNRYVFGVLSERADALLKELQASRTTRGRVESQLMQFLHTGEASMDAIADKLGMGRQTLYRSLKSEGVTFEQVLDELRHKLALHFLAGKKVSVNETAYLLGFSDPAAFSRAFKRWTGASPGAVRGGKL
jgi:AraC-like DNA-binding protein